MAPGGRVPSIPKQEHNKYRNYYSPSVRLHLTTPIFTAASAFRHFGKQRSRLPFRDGPFATRQHGACMHSPRHWTLNRGEPWRRGWLTTPDFWCYARYLPAAALPCSCSLQCRHLGWRFVRRAELPPGADVRQSVRAFQPTTTSSLHPSQSFHQSIDDDQPHTSIDRSKCGASGSETASPPAACARGTSPLDLRWNPRDPQSPTIRLPRGRRRERARSACKPPFHRFVTTGAPHDRSLPGGGGNHRTRIAPTPVVWHDAPVDDETCYEGAGGSFRYTGPRAP